MTDIVKEKWTQWAALTTTILAVCASISALKGGGYSTRVQILTTKETNTWAYFQAKSTKQHVTDTQREVLAALASLAVPSAAGGGNKVAETLARYEADSKRYDGEKNEIKAQAEKLGQEAEFFKKHAGLFGLAVMLLQISIMLSSVGVLVKRRALWVVGLCFGAAGLVYMSLGFWL